MNKKMLCFTTLDNHYGHTKSFIGILARDRLNLLHSSIPNNSLLGDFDMDTITSNNPSVVRPPEVTLVPNNSLLTETPEDGRQLAVKMARLIIKMTQPDEEKRNQLREVYGNDAMMLIAVGHVVAIEFATVAAANNYWRK
jgi:Hexameric tyrosine-coordinated heme protein (HTHP)